MKKNDLVGKTFGRLTVIKEVERNNRGERCFLCKCNCGNEKIIVGWRLTTKNKPTQSCGCLHKEIVSNTFKTHGDSNERLYHIYKGMINRCLNENDKSYKYYGGRGIKLCDEWLNDYELFKKWSLDNGYNELLTIERVDINGNYEPRNCRWATRKEQANNTRKNHLLEYNGKLYTMSELSELCGINYSTLRKRINDMGWSVEKAVSKKDYRSKKEEN